MPTATINGQLYAFTDEGDGPPIVFGHGLLASKEMFSAQIAALRDRYRCLSLDWPGHGESGLREEGWSLEDMAEDAVALLDHLELERATFAGLSQGGMAFMRLALRHPERVERLILLDTSAGPENPESLPRFEGLREGLYRGDDATRRELAGAVAEILYGPVWRERDPAGLEHELALMLAHDREGQNLAARAVFDRTDITAEISAITAPTLVIVGELDVATPPDRAREITEAISGARLVTIPDAGHHTAIENPEPVTAAIEEFLAA